MNWSTFTANFVANSLPLVRISIEFSVKQNSRLAATEGARHLCRGLCRIWTAATKAATKFLCALKVCPLSVSAFVPSLRWNSPLPLLPPVKNQLLSRMKVRSAVLSLGIVALIQSLAFGQTTLPLATPAADASGAITADNQAGLTELLGLTDPTVLKRRIWMETEWDEFKGGAHALEETLGALWGWGVSTNVDWGVRLKLPYEWRTASGSGGGLTEDGLGDLKLGSGVAFRLSKSWRTTGGLELRMPTAADHLGGRDWRLQELGAVAWDVTRWLTLSPSFEYNQSLAEIDDGPPQHYLEVFFPVTFLLPHHWAITPRYEAKVDFERNNYLVQSVKLQVAKQLNHLPLNLALAIKKPFYNGNLDNGLKELQVNFIVTYYLR
jgi:hypothetical protein